MSRDGQEESIEIDSAGTHAYHVGKGPDGRAEEAAGRRGFDLSPLRARTVKPDDFHQFDYILAMDSSNYDDLIAICPAGQEHRVKMFLEFAPQVSETEVPDPYYGGHSGFEHARPG
ncbi:low molecular weight protein-tyrosine-phosphatase [Candidatus Reidiella endopervernicosa]|uniref:low molecular weight protein-tyrosine-phosphatase n=1 Tax=Candidatus Reidiella endopervernicosa TaxID=2738883 RepID=UPI002A4E2D18|nr:low molecular weight protein-tyrosine-phosphatase [Candidatus Reidiella endopervernicosa]